MPGPRPLHLAHWGTFRVQTGDGEVVAVRPWAGDSDPLPILENLVGVVRHRARVARPAVRRGLGERGPGPDERRGREDYVQPPWDEVLDALSGELRRVIDTHGNQAIYAGSYGWASAGRFHHAQSHVHRLLNCLGGYTRYVNTYSSGAADGVAKTPHWAAGISGVPAPVITAVAQALPRHRSMLSVSWSLQRAQYGEQVPWLGIVLVAAISELLLHPGLRLRYDGGSRWSAHLVAMRAAVPRFEQARDDYETFTAMAHRLGVGEAFTQGRDTTGWLRHLYDDWVSQVGSLDPAGAAELPTFDGFWAAGSLPLPPGPPINAFAAYRADPDANPRPTASGRIEITSPAIAALDLSDCPGHPAWLNPIDAAARGLGPGQLVRVFNDRGALLAGVRIDDAVRPDVVQLTTGAWFDPLPDEVDEASQTPGLCVHGNPNVLTPDVRMSALAQACAGAHALVQVEAYHGEPVPLRCYDPPVIG